MARGREGGRAVDTRVARAAAVTLPDGASIDTIENGGPVARSIARFCALLERYAAKRSRETTRKRSPAAG
jgi:ribose 1,5-bisphosphokinase PhnN